MNICATYPKSILDLPDPALVGSWLVLRRQINQALSRPRLQRQFLMTESKDFHFFPN